MVLSRNEIKQIIIETLVPIGVQKISLFGSFARGDITPQSDIDILVQLQDHKKRKLIGLKWFTLDEELEKKIGLPVDLVTESSISKHLKSIIEKDLEVIYDKTR